MFKTVPESKLLLYLLATVNFVHIMDFMIMMPLGEMFMRIFKISPAQFSFVVSSYTLAAGLSSFIGAFWIDRLNRRAALLITFAGFVIGTLGCAFAVSYETLLLTRGITGLFGGVMTALIISIASDLYPIRERGYAMGILTSAFSVASVVGVPAGLFLANLWGWRAPFVSMFILGLAILVLLYKMLPSYPASEVGKTTGPIQVLVNIFSKKNQIYALILGFIVVLGHFMIIPFITPYLIRNVGFSDAQIPLVYMIGGGATIFTAPYFGRLTDRYGPVRVFKILLIMSFIPVLLLTNLWSSPLVVGLMVTTVFFIFGSGRMIPVQTLITGAVHAESRGSFMSIRSSFQQLATSIAAILSGLFVYENADGLLSGYNLLGIVAIGVSALALLFSRKIKIVE
jgi:predicted MFS family arabinose efflux permease